MQRVALNETVLPLVGVAVVLGDMGQFVLHHIGGLEALVVEKRHLLVDTLLLEDAVEVVDELFGLYLFVDIEAADVHA